MKVRLGGENLSVGESTEMHKRLGVSGLKMATYFASKDFPEFTDSVGVALSPWIYRSKKTKELHSLS